MKKTIQELKYELREQINIGKIVSAYDEYHPEYLEELFLVIGFQLAINEKKVMVALMDHEYKTFMVHVDNIILKSLFTIDDMFPSGIKTQHMSDSV